MRRLVPFVVALLIGTVPAAAKVVVTIDKSTQHMSISVDGTPRYNFVVSTGRAGYGTPNGTYHPERLARTWFSKKYYNSPMPHSIFFHGGYAIHGSYACTRQTPQRSTRWCRARARPTPPSWSPAAARRAAARSRGADVRTGRRPAIPIISSRRPIRTRRPTANLSIRIGAGGKILVSSHCRARCRRLSAPRLQPNRPSASFIPRKALSLTPEE